VNIETLTTFFMWCTIINGTIFILWGSFCMLAPNLVYRTQSTFFQIPREQFTVIIYCFLGAFKIFLMFFNLVPFIALLLIR
jgi:hypothetical protein